MVENAETEMNNLQLRKNKFSVSYIQDNTI